MPLLEAVVHATGSVATNGSAGAGCVMLVPVQLFEVRMIRMQGLPAIALFALIVSIGTSHAGTARTATRPSAKQPARPNAPAPRPAAAARADQVLVQLRDLELLTILNRLALRREPATALLTALEEAWAARRLRDLEEDRALAALDFALLQARAALLGGQLLDPAFQEELLSRIGVVFEETKRRRADLNRQLAIKVGDLLTLEQWQRVLSPELTPPRPPASARLTIPEGLPGSLMTRRLGGLRPSTEESLAGVRAISNEQYAQLRQMLLSGPRLFPPSAAERAELEALVNDLDQVRGMNDARFAEERSALAAQVRARTIAAFGNDMLRGLRLIPDATLDRIKPQLLEGLLTTLPPGSAEAAQARDYFHAFIDRVRGMSVDEFEQERANLLQQMTTDAARLEEVQQSYRARREELTREAQARWRQALEEFVARTLMDPRMVVVLRERTRKP